jgi:hypothetical protein
MVGWAPLRAASLRTRCLRAYRPLQSSKFELVISLYRAFSSFRTSSTNRISITSS